MSISKSLMDSYAIRQIVKIKNTFVDTVYNALLVKEFW